MSWLCPSSCYPGSSLASWGGIGNSPRQEAWLPLQLLCPRGYRAEDSDSDCLPVFFASVISCCFCNPLLGNWEEYNLQKTSLRERRRRPNGGSSTSRCSEDKHLHLILVTIRKSGEAEMGSGKVPFCLSENSKFPSFSLKAKFSEEIILPSSRFLQALISHILVSLEPWG